jgi:hypothetical protein
MRSARRNIAISEAARADSTPVLTAPRITRFVDEKADFTIQWALDSNKAVPAPPTSSAALRSACRNVRNVMSPLLIRFWRWRERRRH